MSYVDGFLLVVPKKKLAAYKKMAALGAKIWMKYGALDYKECIGDDMNPKGQEGMQMGPTFPKVANAKPDEVVVFSYIVFKSKAHRNQVNKKVMSHFDKKYADHKDQAMPFDMARMAYCGFSVAVD